MDIGVLKKFGIISEYDNEFVIVDSEKLFEYGYVIVKKNDEYGLHQNILINVDKFKIVSNTNHIPFSTFDNIFYSFNIPKSINNKKIKSFN